MNCFVCSSIISTERLTGEISGYIIKTTKRRTANKHHIIPATYNDVVTLNPAKQDYEETVYLCTKCHGLVHSIIAKDAIVLAYTFNPMFFHECLYKARESMRDG